MKNVYYVLLQTHFGSQDALFNYYDLSEMYPLLRSWHRISISEVPKKTGIITTLFCVAIFLALAIIVSTARTAWEENTWRAWAVLFVVAVQVTWN